MWYIDLFWILMIPIFRSIAGWATKALEDGIVSEFEYRQLAITVSQVGTMALVGYFGLNAVGFDISGLAAGCGAFLFDKVLGAIKDMKRK